jgi:hypothetical protein
VIISEDTAMILCTRLKAVSASDLASVVWANVKVRLLPAVTALLVMQVVVFVIEAIVVFGGTPVPVTAIPT